MPSSTTTRLTELQHRVLRILAATDTPMGRNAVAGRAHTSTAGASRALNALADLDLITSRLQPGVGRGRPVPGWAITSAGRSWLVDHGRTAR